MAVNGSRDIISVVAAIFGVFLLFSAATNFQQLKVVDLSTIVFIVAGLVSFYFALKLSGKK